MKKVPTEKKKKLAEQIYTKQKRNWDSPPLIRVAKPWYGVLRAGIKSRKIPPIIIPYSPMAVNNNIITGNMFGLYNIISQLQSTSSGDGVAELWYSRMIQHTAQQRILIKNPGTQTDVSFEGGVGFSERDVLLDSGSCRERTTWYHPYTVSSAVHEWLVARMQSRKVPVVPHFLEWMGRVNGFGACMAIGVSHRAVHVCSWALWTRLYFQGVIVQWRN